MSTILAVKTMTPSLTVRPSSVKEDEKAIQQRRLVVQELVETEKTYSVELARFVESVCPRMEVGDTPQKTRFTGELTDLIHNLEQFLHLSRRAIQELESSSATRIGPAAIRLVSVLPLYTQYAKNYALKSKVIRELMNDEEFQRDWRGEPREKSVRITKTTSQRLSRRSSNIDVTTAANGNSSNQEQQNASITEPAEASSASSSPTHVQQQPFQEKRTTLEGFLILPVQRVPRYSLLFQEILKRLEQQGIHRSEADEKEKSDIQFALDASKKCALAMNEAIEGVKRIFDLKDLQDRFNDPNLIPIFTHPDAKVLKSDILCKVSRSGVRKKYLYHIIAPDAVLCSGAEEDPHAALRLRRVLKLTAKSCSVEIKEDSEDQTNCFVLETAERTQILVAGHKLMRDEWVETLSGLIKEQQAKAPAPVPRRSFFARRSSSSMGGSSPTSPGLRKTFSTKSTVSTKQQTSGMDNTRSKSFYDKKMMADETIPVLPRSSSTGTPIITSTTSNGRGTPNPFYLQQNGEPASPMTPNSLNQTQSSPACHICSTAFSILHRRHSCGRCGRDVCSSCSTQRRCLVNGVQPAVRICDMCGDDMDFASELLFPNLIRLCCDITGGFRRESGTSAIQFSKENYWSIVFGKDQIRGPSGIGRFSIFIPQYTQTNSVPNIELFLLAKQGGVILGVAEIDAIEVIRNSRCVQGFTERVDIFDVNSRQQRIATVCVTYSLEQPIELFSSTVESISSELSHLGVRAAQSDGNSPSEKDKRRSFRRRSLNGSSESTATAAQATSLVSQQSSSTRQKLNLQLLKEYEKLALDNPESTLLARMVDILLNWAIDNEQEGGDTQASLSNMLYRFHRNRSNSASRKNGPPTPNYQGINNGAVFTFDEKTSTSTQTSQQDLSKEDTASTNPILESILQSETEYIQRLELMVEKNKKVNDEVSISLGNGNHVVKSSATIGKGTVLRLASTFGQTSAATSEHSLGAMLSIPSVASCLSVCEQMVTIHRSFLVDLKQLGTTDSLLRLASLTKVYSSYGATLAEAYQAVSSLISNPSPNGGRESTANNTSATKRIDEGFDSVLSSTRWFHYGAGQSDPEDVLRWILMANGKLTPFRNPPSDLNEWSLLDLLMCPLIRMNEYCQYARGLDSSAYLALNETRKLLSKSIMKKSNTRLLKELEIGMMDLSETLVDTRRWMIRTSSLIWRDVNNIDRPVQAFLFSDQLLLCKPVTHDRWMVLRQFFFSDKANPIFLRDCSDQHSAEGSNGSLILNSSNMLGDPRFAFEVGFSGADSTETMMLLMPNSTTALVSRQTVQFWNRLGLVAFDKDTGFVVGPGGFSNVDALPKRNEAGTMKSNDRSKDMKRKQQMKLEWVSDILRLLKIWHTTCNGTSEYASMANISLADTNSGLKTDVCWLDDIMALNLIQQSKANSISEFERTTIDFGENNKQFLGPPPLTMRSESAPT